VQSWLVADALRQLSAPHREVLVECFYRGASVTEAADRLGGPAGTVKSRTHYALRALKLALEEVGGAAWPAPPRATTRRTCSVRCLLRSGTGTRGIWATAPPARRRSGSWPGCPG